MYQALYRKYRPQTFDDVVGQRSITETLKTQLKAGRMSHAYLFTGTRGTGKTSCAKILARAVNCTDLQDGNPCGRCAACEAIAAGSCMDVLEIDAASNNGVDHVRALRDDAIYSPSQVQKRVYIIDEVHMLSMSAFNALLKIIEEPPEHLMFILATTELHKVPATILSRCQRFSFRRLMQEDIAGRLNYIAYEEGIDLEPDATRLLARLADGSLRDGISLLDQCASSSGGAAVTVDLVCGTLGLAGQQQAAQLLFAAADHNTAAALHLFSQLYSSGKDIAAMLDELSSLCRDLLILKTAPKSGISMLSGIASEEEALQLQNRFTPAELLRMLSVLQETAAGFAKSANRRVDAELCLLRLCDPGLDMDAKSINARLSRVEDQLSSGMIMPKAPAVTQEELPPPPDDSDVPPIPEDAPPVPPRAETPSGFWPDFVAKIRGELSGKYLGYFSVDGSVGHKLEGDLLTLVAESEFVKKIIDTPDVHEKAVRCASALLGRPISVRIVQKSKHAPGAGGRDPLQDLMSFGQAHNDIFTIK